MRIKIYLATLFLMVIALTAVSACQPRTSDCPLESITYIADPGALHLADQSEASQGGPVKVEIRGRALEVDRVVHGPLCSDHWAGKIYVACDLQIAAWEGDPTFLEGCPLTIEPGTVVYVAAHNDEAFYKGCSCHTGEEQDY